MVALSTPSHATSLDPSLVCSITTKPLVPVRGDGCGTLHILYPSPGDEKYGDTIPFRAPNVVQMSRECWSSTSRCNLRSPWHEVLGMAWASLSPASSHIHSSIRPLDGHTAPICQIHPRLPPSDPCLTAETRQRRPCGLQCRAPLNIKTAHLYDEL